MTQQDSSKNIQHLQNLFNQRSPKTKYFSQSRIQQFTDSITKQIINGDTVVNQNQDDSSGKAKNRYQQQLKKHKLSKANKQKDQLQRKLQYVNRSIDSIKKYSYLKAEHEAQNQLSHSRQKNQEQILMLKQRKKQMNQSIKKHKQKIQKIRKQGQQKKKVLRQQQFQLQKKVQKDEKERKKKEILENMKKIKEQMEARDEQNQKSTQKVKELIKKKELFHKMEDWYKQKQAQTLQERKRKLSEIRNFYKPIDLNEIKEHQKKVQQLKKQKQDLRLRQKKINQSSVHYKVSYMGSYYKELLQKKSQNEDPLTSSKLKIDKIKQFSQHIKQHFVPQISERKKRQIEDSIQKQEQMKKAREQKLEQVIQLRKQKGLEYMELMRKIPKKKNGSKVEEQGSKTARPVYKNYLEHSVSLQSPHKTERAWTKILTKKQLNKKQKARLLQYESEKMEQILKRKEQESRLLKKNNEEDIDQEYYNMIKAKLSLLTSQ